jgi:hypothetical protein
MIGSGIGNFGGGNLGIYGQQPWQEEARKKAFQNSYMRGLQMQTPSAFGANPSQQFNAAAYAASFLPSGATLGGGTTISSGLLSPFAGGRINQTGNNYPNDWMRNMPQYQFPMMGRMAYS